MTEYAELDKDGKVLRVIVIEAGMLANGHWGDPANWVERKTPAGIGYTYDKVRDVFVLPKQAETPLAITANSASVTDVRL